jgi:RNA recognition motif-containing protein
VASREDSVFLVMPSEDNAYKAIKETNGTDLRGTAIRVNEAYPRPSGGPRRGGGANRSGSALRGGTGGGRGGGRGSRRSY